MPDFTVPIALLKKPIEDLYSLASGQLKETIAKVRTTAKVKNLHGRLWQSQRVKTIWHTDRPLSLSSFFHPVTVMRRTDSGSTSIRLNTLEDLPDLHNLIFGTVGQGKSILLRYLLGKEIRSGTRIPLLCELRNVDSGELEKYLIDAFGRLLDVTPDKALFDFFGGNGKISFLLDGFDEIEPSIVPNLMQEIENLSARFPYCRIALTSRPDSECKHLTSFNTVNIRPLENADLHPFYKRLTRDEDFTRKLIAAINASPLQIRDLVVTPLLATLLAISYQAAQKIPLDFAEFYDDLFQILLTRHDGSKLGWRRNRKTKLNDREIQQVFEAFCFATRKRQVTSIEKDDVYKIAQDSLANTKIDADPQNFIQDITKITCLLIEEGKKTSFVHSSVQEFFSARYVKTRAEQVAENFYSKLLSKQKWRNWSQELIFLQQIDEHRSTKYFLIPDLESTLKYLIHEADAPIEQDIENYLSGISVRKSVQSIDNKHVVKYFVHFGRSFHSYHLDSLDSRTYSKLFEPSSPRGGNWISGFVANSEILQRSYLQIAHDRGEEFKNELFTMVRATIRGQQAELVKTKEAIATDESTSGFVDLDFI